MLGIAPAVQEGLHAYHEKAFYHKLKSGMDGSAFGALASF